MSTWIRKISVISFGWIALTCAAAAQSAANDQSMPLGDVWVSSRETGTHQRMSSDNTAAPESDVLTGDIWIAADDLLGAA